MRQLHPDSLKGLILEGDCLEKLQAIPDNCISSCVCDPPYGLEFMGKEWDKLEPNRERQRWRGTERKLIGSGAGRGGNFGDRMGELPTYRPKRNARCKKCGHYRFSGNPCECAEPDWDFRAGEHARKMQEWYEEWCHEVLRVLKPGGHLLAAGGSRTFHRLTCAIEDAGFEIRDCICHHFSTGFPKALNVGKAIDKAVGAKRKVVGRKIYAGGHVQNSSDEKLEPPIGTFKRVQDRRDLSLPATEEAAKWGGWATALKPSTEFWVLARKPLSEKTVAANVLKWGTGALATDLSRVGTPEDRSRPPRTPNSIYGGGKGTNLTASESHPSGRWPTNTILSHHSECVKKGMKRISTVTVKQRVLEVVYGSQKPQDGNDGTILVEAWDCHPDCPVRILDEQSGETSVTGKRTVRSKEACSGKGGGNPFASCNEKKTEYPGDRGTASRFFQQCNWSEEELSRFRYCAKPSKREKEAVVSGKNIHPT